MCCRISWFWLWFRYFFQTVLFSVTVHFRPKFIYIHTPTIFKVIYFRILCSKQKLNWYISWSMEIIKFWPLIILIIETLKIKFSYSKFVSKINHWYFNRYLCTFNFYNLPFSTVLVTLIVFPCIIFVYKTLMSLKINNLKSTQRRTIIV